MWQQGFIAIRRVDGFKVFSPEYISKSDIRKFHAVDRIDSDIHHECQSIIELFSGEVIRVKEGVNSIKLQLQIAAG